MDIPLKNNDLTSHEQIAGAVYFVMGRGTEGGNSSYHLSITGVTNPANATDPRWGDVKRVIAASGYTLGTIQVDFGQRGAWALGAINGRPLQPGEKTYVQAVVDEVANYSKMHSLPFTNDHSQLKQDLLTKGSKLKFIDTVSRDAINHWASSREGRQWIHQNIDLPQARNVSNLALDILERYGNNIPEEKRFEVACILAKTANQLPGVLPRLETTLANGGGYDGFMESVAAIRGDYKYYAGEHAGILAARYEQSYEAPIYRDALTNAHVNVSSPNFDPSTEAVDLDIQMALSAIGQRPAIDPTVWRLQQNLNALNVTGARDQKLVVDGDLGDANSRTHQAIATFKQQHGLTEPMTNTELLMATQVAMKVKQSLDFDRPILDGLPGPAQTPQMVNGLPDYMVSGPNALSQKPSTAQTPQAPLQAAPSHMPQHTALPPSDTQRDQAPESFAPSARAAASEPDPLAARLAELQREMDAFRRQMQHDNPSPHNGQAPRHEADLHADARSTAMDGPSRIRSKRESEPEPQQPCPQRDAQAFPAGHRDYALFEAIRRQLPDEYSDEMAAHATLEAKRGGITRPDQIKGMAVENGRLTVMGKTGMDFAVVELTASAPPLQETLQQSAAFDQQQTIRLAQFQEQQLNVGRGGPSMTL